MSGANPSAARGAFVFAPENLHLFADGQELPQTDSIGWGATYELPSEPQRYRLTALNAAGTTSTTWNFTSSAPDHDETPQGFLCPQGAGIPCRADPLVFLRYDVGADLTDAVPAPGLHRIHVTAYHHAPDAPPIESLKLSISTDGGATWQSVSVESEGNGDYTARYRVPRLADTTGTVSIKAHAEDADGNSIDQTVLDAFRLEPRH